MNAKAESANLDYLRANAVLLVLLFHVLLFFGKMHIGSLNLRPMGGLGVLLFFVHTSLVLMYSLERQEQKFGPRGLFSIFMVRRIFRIYPLSVLAVSLICLFRIPLGHLEPHHLIALPGSFRVVFSNLALIQDITETGSVLGPLWSLPYEVQMYVFLPFVWMFARKARSTWSVFGLWVVSLAVALIHGRFGHMPDLVRYVPCFLPGIIAYKAGMRSRRQLPFFCWPIFLLLVYTGYMFAQGADRGWLTCLATGFGISGFREMQNRWLRKASHLVAKYSYGIYLSHYFSLWLAFQKLAGLAHVLQWTIFATSAVALPVVLFHGLEDPMIKLGAVITRKLKARAPSAVPLGVSAASQAASAGQ